MRVAGSAQARRVDLEAGSSSSFAEMKHSRDRERSIPEIEREFQRLMRTEAVERETQEIAEREREREREREESAAQAEQGERWKKGWRASARTEDEAQHDGQDSLVRSQRCICWHPAAWACVLQHRMHAVCDQTHSLPRAR